MADLPLSVKLLMISYSHKSLALCNRREHNEIMKIHKQLVYFLIKKNENTFRFLYYYNIQHIHDFCKLNSFIIEFLPISYKNDVKFMKDKVKKHPIIIKFATDYCAIEILKDFLINKPKLLREMIPHVRSKNVIIQLDLFEKYIGMYDILNDELKHDEDIVKIVFKYRADVYMLLPERIRCERENVLSAIKRDRLIYDMLPEELRADREITMRSVSLNGYFIFNAPEELQEDDEIRFFALRRSPSIINRLPLKYRSDIDTLIFALSFENKYRSQIILSPELKLKLDKDIVLRLIDTNCVIYDQIPVEYLLDRYIAMKLLKNNYIAESIYPIYHNLFETDRELLEYFISHNPFMIQHVDEKFKKDRELVKIAVRSDKLSCICNVLSDDFYTDREIMTIALENNINNFEFLDDELKSDKQMILTFLKNPQYSSYRYKGDLIASFPIHIRNDPEIIILF